MQRAAHKSKRSLGASLWGWTSLAQRQPTLAGTYGKITQNRIAGGLYHVTSRDNARGAIYPNDEDRLSWLELFNEVCSFNQSLMKAATLRQLRLAC